MGEPSLPWQRRGKKREKTYFNWKVGRKCVNVSRNGQFVKSATEQIGCLNYSLGAK